MLSSLAFDTQGNLTLGLRDRSGDQTNQGGESDPAPGNPNHTTGGYSVTAGDTLRAGLVGTNTWQLENNGSVTTPTGTITSTHPDETVATITPTGATKAGTTVTITTAAPNTFATGNSVVISGVNVAGYNGTVTITRVNSTTFTYTAGAGVLAASGGGTVTLDVRFQDGPQGVGNAPFYWQTWYNINQTNHSHTSQGAVLQIPGFPDILTTAEDPAFGVTTNPNQGTNAGGIAWYNTTTGLNEKGYQIYQSAGDRFGKANGLGDLIALTYSPIEIGDRVFKDIGNGQPNTAGNGIQDAGEAGIAGVTVDLFDGNTKIASVVTDANGNYLFSSDPTRTSTTADFYGLHLQTNHTYTVRIDNAANYGAGQPLVGLTASPALQGTDTTIDSNGVIAGNTDVRATVTTGSTHAVDHTIDFGFTQPVTIGDFVFKDTNGNGIQDAGELGIPGVTVHLFDPLGNSLATAVTDANGKYTFSSALGTSSTSVIDNISGLKANTAGYTIKLDKATDYSTGGLLGLTASPALQGADTTKDSNGVLVGVIDQATVSTPAPGATDNSFDFGFTQPVTIGDFVFKDTNGNGIQDAGELGIAGVTVHLFDPLGNSLATAVTDANGKYTFSSALGTSSTSVIDNISGLKANTAGYTIKLDKATDYSTGGLLGLTASPALQGADTTKDSNGVLVGVIDQATVSTPAPGATDNSFDFGFTQPVTIGDFVFKDTNGNGIQDAGELGIAGVTVHLFDPLGNSLATAVTDANGKYTFSSAIGAGSTSVIDNLTSLVASTAGYTIKLDKATDYSTGALLGLTASPALQGADTTKDSNGVLVGVIDQATVSTPAPGATDNSFDFGFTQPVTIGDFVFKDTNGNGIQDAGELGIAGVTVHLFDPLGNSLATAVTDANGKYTFSSAIGAGSTSVIDNLTSLVASTAGYTIKLDKATDYSTGGLLGLTASPALQGADTTKDSNGVLVGVIDQATVSTPAPGATDNSFDFGFTQPVTIGDFVFKDTNGNGIQDAGELGIPGVTVHLFDPLGNSLATAVTDANGKYTFSSAIGAGSTSVIDNLTSLVASTAGYTIKLDKATDYSTGALLGLTASPALQGADTTKDSNGVLVGVIDQATVSTPAPGATDNSFDFGFTQPVTIGDFVFKDTNGNGIQDAGELGIAGVTVHLFDPLGNSLATAVTDANGKYTFSSAIGAGSTSVIDNISGLKANTAGYTIKLDKATDYSTGALLGLTASPAFARCGYDEGLERRAGGRNRSSDGEHAGAGCQ